MAVSTIKGGDKLAGALRAIAQKLKKASTLRVGFLENAVYPNGTPVAMVAAVNNFGAPRASIPKRPFFSDMVASKSNGWPKIIGAALAANDMDGERALAITGEHIKGELQESIINTMSPALSPITIMLRGMKSADQSLVVTGKTVGEAARRVAEGKTNYGASTKPLIETGWMLDKVGSDVK